MPLTTKGANHILSVLHGRASAFTPPVSYFVGLFQADPGVAGALTSEVSNSDYTRVNLTSICSNASGGWLNNATALVYSVALSNWGTARYLGILDTSTLGQGQMVSYIALPTAVPINVNDQFVLAASHYAFNAL